MSIISLSFNNLRRSDPDIPDVRILVIVLQNGFAVHAVLGRIVESNAKPAEMSN